MTEIIKEGYARVTDIIVDKEALAAIPPHILENARLRGNRVDELCKAYIMDLPAIAQHEEDKGFFESFKLWAKGKEAGLTVGERLYDDTLMITGCPDLVYVYDNRFMTAVVDTKATSGESKTWKLQGAAYAYLLRENGIEVNSIQFLRLKKDGTKPVLYEYSFEENFDMFMHFYHRYCFLGHHPGIKIPMKKQKVA